MVHWKLSVVQCVKIIVVLVYQTNNLVVCSNNALMFLSLWAKLIY